MDIGVGISHYSEIKEIKMLSKHIKDLTGQRFGKLVVKEFIGLTSDKHSLWLCHCDCGNSKSVASYQLKRGSVLTCGCYKRGLDLTNKRFNRLTARKIVGRNKNKSILWLCDCDCGNTKVVSSIALTSSGTMSCGCLYKELHRLQPTESGCNLLFAGYRCRANKFSIPFILTKIEFRQITSNSCFYCGSNPKAISCSSNMSNETRKLSSYTYNGIDRIDSTKGYEIDNCVACCKTCNYAKNTMSVDEFKNWVKRVHDHLCL